MAEISGVSGAFSLATGYDLEAFAWSLSMAREGFDVTVLGDEWGTTVSGPKNHNGTASLFYNSTQALAIATLIGSSVVTTLTLITGKTYVGTSLITNVRPTVPIDGVDTIEITFAFKGDLSTVFA